MTSRTLSALALLCLALFGCGRGNFSERANAPSDTLRIAAEVNPTTLDPALVQDVYTYEILGNVYETLVGYDAENKLVPRLAEKWDVEDGGRAYVFHLRPDVKFHHGRPLEAVDFKKSVERSAAPTSNSPTASTYLDDVKGFAEFQAGKAKEIVGIQVVDPRTVRIELIAPRAYFLGKLTYPVAAVIPVEAVGTGEISTPAKAIGTGPFRLTEYLDGQQLILERWDGYYGEKAKVARVQEVIVKDPIGRVTKFRGAELDVAPVARVDAPALRKDAAIAPQLGEHLLPSISYIALNPKAFAPFRDVRVRRAFALAFNRESITQDTLQGVPAAKGVLPPGIPGHDPNFAGLPYDVPQARRLLAEAGYPDGKGFPKLELAIRENLTEARLIGERLAGDLKRDLGIQISLRSMETRAFQEAQNKRSLPFFAYGWVADYLDPQDFLSLLLTSKSPMNFFGFENAEFDRLCAQADAMPDGPERLALYAQAERLAIEQVAWIPIYFQSDFHLVGPRVKGFRVNAFGVMPLNSVSLQ